MNLDTILWLVYPVIVLVLLLALVYMLFKGKHSGAIKIEGLGISLSITRNQTEECNGPN